MAMALAMAMTLVCEARWDGRRYPSEFGAQLVKSSRLHTPQSSCDEASCERLTALEVLSRRCCDVAFVPKSMTMRAEMIPQASLDQRPAAANQQGNLDRLRLALSRHLSVILKPLPRPLLQFLQAG